MKMLEQWLPGDKFGDPVACIATSFTFDSNFFEEECLTRFLSISTRDPDEESGIDLAGMLEEEERLATTQVTVLVDQSCSPTPRNLRWDLMHVRVPQALLHAKVAVLMWSNATRVIIGSANLTSAGYRDKVEAATSFDLDATCTVPRSVLLKLAKELRSIIELSPGDTGVPGPGRRALQTVDKFELRVKKSPILKENNRGVRYWLSSTRDANCVVDDLKFVWSGQRPSSVVALSPFWDKDERSAGANALFAPIQRTRSSAAQLSSTFVVPVDYRTGKETVLAPVSLANCAPESIRHEVVAFQPENDRRVHAKCLQYFSGSWQATMIGSSNMTAKGLGTDRRPHFEINLWFGCRRSSQEGKFLSQLIPLGEPVREDAIWEPEAADDDEPTTPAVPEGFIQALLTSSNEITVTFNPSKLPSTWEVRRTLPDSSSLRLLTSQEWLGAQSPTHFVLKIPDHVSFIPSFLEVTWTGERKARNQALWLVNISDSTVLPPPLELRQIPIQTLLALLASTRPLRQALEDVLQRNTESTSHDSIDLDPLRRFDSSGFLLQRTRRTAATLWGIERRLSRPITTMDALEWRLTGILGPEHIANLLLESSNNDSQLVGEIQFILAELALVLSRIEWSHLCSSRDLKKVKSRIDETIRRIEALSQSMPVAEVDDGTRGYIERAFKAARK